jgi:hypothetical protein
VTIRLDAILLEDHSVERGAQNLDLVKKIGGRYLPWLRASSCPGKSSFHDAARLWRHVRRIQVTDVSRNIELRAVVNGHGLVALLSGARLLAVYGVVRITTSRMSLYPAHLQTDADQEKDQQAEVAHLQNRIFD